MAELQRRTGGKREDNLMDWPAVRNMPSYMQEFLPQYLGYLEETEKELPTDYQEVWSYALVKMIFREIQDVIADAEIKDKRIEKLPPIPVFGTVRMGNFSAQIVCPIADDYLIVFSEGLFGFSNLFSKVLAGSFVLEKTDDERISFSTDLAKIEKHMGEHPEIQQHFDDLLLAYMVNGHPHAARQYYPMRELASMISILCDGMETFVAAHEYSHLVLGHLADTSRKFRETASENRADTLENAEIQEIFYQWKDEVQADILAMDITMQVMLRRGYDKALSFMGIQAAMLGMELLDRMQNLKEGKDPLQPVVCATHPSAEMRKQILQQEARKLEENILELVDVQEKMVDLLWNNFMGFYRMLERSLREGSESVFDVPFWITQEVIYRRNQEKK